jgi:hypothetical protein
MAGSCDRRVESVQHAFDDNLAVGLEAGAACAVVVDGRLVVDLWGGTRRDTAASPPGGGGSQPTLAQRMHAPVLAPSAPPMNEPAFRAAAIPVTGAATTAVASATICGDLARDHSELLSPVTVHAIGEVQIDGPDAILGVSVARTHIGNADINDAAWAGQPGHDPRSANLTRALDASR